MRKFYLLTTLVALTLCSQLQAQSTLLPSGVDLDQVTWVDGDVLVRFEDHLSIDFDKFNKTGYAPIDAILQDLDIREVEQLFPYEINIPDRNAGFYSYNGLYVEYPELKNIYRIHFRDSLGANLFNVIEDLEALTDYVKYAEPNYYSGIMGVSPANEPNDTLYSQQWANEAIQADTVQARMAADSTVSDTNQVIAIIDTGVDKDHEDLKNKMWVNIAELNGSPGVDDDQNGFIDDTYGWDFINNDGNPMDDNSHGTHCAGSAAAEVNNQKGIAGVSPGAKIMAVKVMQSSGYGASADIAQGILYAANNGASVISMSIGGAAQSQVQKDALAVAYAYSFLVGAAGNNGKCIGIPNPTYFCPDGKKPIQIYPGAFSYVLGVEASSPSGGKAGFSNWDQDGPIVSAWPDLLNYEVRAPGAQIISSLPAGNTGSNSRYAFKQGTSMATPAVAGAVALLKSFKPTFTHEKVFLHLIKTQTNNIQLNTAIDYILPSEITYVTNTVVDTINGDADNRPDAGETVELVLKLKNTGGYNDSVWASIELDPLEDPSLVEFIDSVRFFGSVSEYATIENNVPDSAIYPFKIKLDSNIANARDIKFVVRLWTGDSTYVDSSDFVLNIQNGIEFGAAYYPGTTIMYPNKYYLISGTTLFDTLIIKPGTEIYVEENKTINGHKIVCEGTRDSLIVIQGVRGAYWRGIKDLFKWEKGNSPYSWTGPADKSLSSISYTRIKDLNPQHDVPWQNFYSAQNCIVENCLNIYSGEQGLSVYRSSSVDSSDYTYSTNYRLQKKWETRSQYFQGSRPLFSGGHTWINNQTYQWEGKFKQDLEELNYNEFDTIITYDTTNSGYVYHTIRYIHNTNPVDTLALISGNNIYSSTNHIYDWNPATITHTPYTYILRDGDNGDNVVLPSTRNYSYNGGSLERWMYQSVELTQNLMIYPSNIYLSGKSVDFYSELTQEYFDNNDFPIFNTDSLPTSMSNPNAHGYVVDIKLDGISTHWMDNPYNSPSGTGIIGNGTHKFTVQFNREMDTTVTPLLTFGIREPWTQNIVADSAYWSHGGKEFNAYVTIDPLTQSDGINRISVRLAEDNEHFPCPTENQRFECRISSTGSLSAGFTAVGDTGKIHLDWGIPDEAVDDYLGTNMYRIDSSYINNSSYYQPQPVYVDNKMQVDSMMTDTTVQAGIWYGYYYKIVRTSLTELNESDTVWARAWQGKPEVVTLAVDNKTHNGVTLKGKANPNYLNTQVRFNYGTSTNYSTNTTWQNIGNGSTFETRSVNLGGLQPGTLYHYRMEAVNEEGTSYGADSTFRTKDFPTLAYTYDSTLCVGDVLSITNQSTISNGTLSYTWEIRNSSGVLVQSSQDVDPSFTMSTAGTYTVKLTASSSDAVTTTKTSGLVVEAIPTPSITAGGATSFCQGGTVTLTGDTGYQSYSWSNGASTSSIVVADSNTYTLTVTSTNGCAGSTSVNVDVNPLPTATVTTTSGDFDFCDGSSLTLDAPSGAAGYQWYNNGTAVTGATGSSYSAVTSGSYAVEVTSADGCTSLSTAQTVTKNNTPTATITNASALSFCDGDSVVLSGPSNMSYAWTTGATTQSITASTSGQAGLTITDANGCSETATPVQITVHPVPAMAVTAAGSTSICQGESVTLQASGGFSSYAWSSNASTKNIIVTSAGTYTVTGTTIDGCTAQASETVTVNATPTATITNSGSSVLCSGQSATLSAPSGMSSYLWSDGSTTQSITASTAGNYAVTVTSTDGCTATSATTVITTSSITSPQVTSNGPLEFCDGGSVSLAVPMGYSSFMWNNGSGFSQITATTSGDYYAQVMNADGCTTNSDTVTVQVFPTPPTPSISYAANDTLMTSSEATGNQWYFNGVMMPGETGQTLRPLNLGNYSVRIIDSNGCEGDMSAMQFYNSIGVEENLADQITLYPNPTTGQLTVVVGNLAVAQVVLMDATGREVARYGNATGSELHLDLSEEAAGMYVLQLILEDGSTVRQIIGKQ